MNALSPLYYGKLRFSNFGDYNIKLCKFWRDSAKKHIETPQISLKFHREQQQRLGSNYALVRVVWTAVVYIHVWKWNASFNRVTGCYKPSGLHARLCRAFLFIHTGRIADAWWSVTSVNLCDTCVCRSVCLSVFVPCRRRNVEKRLELSNCAKLGKHYSPWQSLGMHELRSKGQRSRSRGHQMRCLRVGMQADMTAWVSSFCLF